MTRIEKAATALKDLPQYIRIAAFDYEIIALPVLDSTSLAQWGSSSSIRQTIELQAVMPSVEKLIDTFFHEIHHAICRSYHILQADDEERHAEILGSAWLQIHRDNSWLTIWLLKHLHEDVRIIGGGLLSA